MAIKISNKINLPSLTVDKLVTKEITTGQDFNFQEKDAELKFNDGIILKCFELSCPPNSTISEPHYNLNYTFKHRILNTMYSIAYRGGG